MRISRCLPALVAAATFAGGCVRTASTSSTPSPAVKVAVEPTPLPTPEKTPTARAATASAFHVWAEREGSIRLEGRGDLPWIRGGVGLSKTVGNRIEHDPSLLKGI